MASYLTLYFSGTGNTMYVAHRFNEKLGGNIFSLEKDFPIDDELYNAEFILFCFPIYFSVAPHIVKEFIRNNRDSFKDKKIILIATQQFYSGDGALSVKKLLPSEASIVYAAHINMPVNIGNIPFYSKLTKGNFSKSILKADNKISDIVENIKSGKVHLRGKTIIGKLIGKTQNTHEELFLQTKRDSIKVKDSCILCSRCIKNCPTNNLVNINEKIGSTNKCIFCYRCVNICPTQSITAFLHSKIDFQYYVINKVKEIFSI